ncbi:MAG: hypothetical protein JST79_20580 [Acidobacteria bacterium]|nr:hypothetical protein [Acidobacteriota bacterium]
MAKYIAKLHNSATGQAVLLFLYLFLVVASFVAGKASRDALFLEQFQAVQLPYADIAISILVGFAVAAYVRLGRAVSLDKLLVLSLSGYIATAVLFWWLGTHCRFAWLYPLVYVWIGVYGVLATAQVWTLANYVFTTREAKSKFSIVGSGAIAGWIAGGYLSKTLAAAYGAESLLLVIAGALTLAIGLVVVIWRGRAISDPQKSAAQAQAGLRARLQQIVSMPHLRTIAVLIGLSSFATTTAGWQFKAMAKQAIPATAQLAAFFGEFNFYAGILSLVVQLTLTSRLIKRFGIGPALLVAPCALLIGSAGTLLLGTLSAAVVLKGFDQVFRYSVDKSTVELLYLPVPFGIKVEAKSLIDTVVWRLGDGLAGVSVLMVANYFRATPQKASWITLAAVLLWGAVALMARKTYVSSLQSIVQGLRPQKQRVAEFAEARVSKNFNRRKIEKILALEIAQHYRSYQVLQQLTEITTEFPERVAELQRSMRLESGRIFRLLAILYPQSDIESTYAAIRSGVPVIRDSALELMENTLQPELHRLLVPLFDEALSVGQRARLAARVLEAAGLSLQPSAAAAR